MKSLTFEAAIALAKYCNNDVTVSQVNIIDTSIVVDAMGTTHCQFLYCGSFYNFSVEADGTTTIHIQGASNV